MPSIFNERIFMCNWPCCNVTDSICFVVVVYLWQQICLFSQHFFCVSHLNFCRILIQPHLDLKHSFSKFRPFCFEWNISIWTFMIFAIHFMLSDLFASFEHALTDIIGNKYEDNFAAIIKFSKSISIYTKCNVM